MSKLIVYLRGGVGSRVFSILAGRAFAQMVGCGFEFYWPAEFEECRCPVESLFENLSSRMEPYDPASPGFHAEDAIDLSVEKIMERLVAGEDVHLSTWYCDLCPKGVSRSDYRARMREETARLRPVAEVLAQVPQVDPGAVGFHIRREDHWRNIRHSPLVLFTRIMDRHIRANSHVAFFLATDSSAVGRDLRRRYGARLRYVERGVYRDSVAGVQVALAEVLALARPGLVYSCNSSCFSDLANLFAVPGRKRILVARGGAPQPADYFASRHDRRHDAVMRWDQQDHAWKVSPRLTTVRERFEGMRYRLWTSFVLSGAYQRWPFHSLREISY